jgi:integrase
VTLLKRRFTKEGYGTYEYWAGRWRDPDTGKMTEFKLEPAVFPSRETRRQWAISRAISISKRRAELASGAPIRTHTEISDAVEGYLGDCENRLRKKTVGVYKTAIDTFLNWAEKNKVGTIEELTPALLSDYRNSRIAQRKQQIAPGRGRGGRKQTSKKRSPSTVNLELRGVKTMLLQWRAEDRLPNADRESICRSLKLLTIPQEPPAYLPPAKIKKLIEASLRHDAALFVETREEHLGLRIAGSTPRYDPITPFVIFLLLSGCRVSEAENLTWDAVDLEALDSNGQHVGEIVLKGAVTKTKRFRSIGLEVSPTLRSLLAAMKLQAGSGPYVFGGRSPLSHSLVEAARKRLVRSYGAPVFSWQNLRQTTSTFLVNSPSIYGAASVYMSARQLGHSVAVSERHYVGIIRGISKEAHNLEQAMQIEDLTSQVVNSVAVVEERTVRSA